MTPSTITFTRPHGSEIEFVLVKGGCFMMGDHTGKGAADEHPVHKVCLDDFFMSKFEITVGQWERVMGQASSKTIPGPNHPMVEISWQETQYFIDRLSEMTGEAYRLPTEAEWEYAARSGGGEFRYATAPSEISHDYCNYDGRAGRDEWIKTSPVGSFPPNPLGLFDMCGNVLEWVEDDYDFHAYKRHAVYNPLIKSPESEQVIRGCGWSDEEKDCRLSIRDKLPPDCSHCNRRNDVGFRLVK